MPNQQPKHPRHRRPRQLTADEALARFFELTHAQIVADVKAVETDIAKIEAAVKAKIDVVASDVVTKLHSFYDKVKADIQKL